MFIKPQVRLIQRLHQYGRELAVLKRMYQSYALIIDRILDRQKPLHSSTGDPSSMSGSHGVALTSKGQVTSEIQTFGAPLSSAATVRFERLRDRINLYALSEIQECLDEKESLVFLVRWSSVPFTAAMLTLELSELQSHNAQRISSGRAPHTHHHSPCQSHHSVHACFTYDRLLLDPNQRSRQCLYGEDVLDMLRGNNGIESCGSGIVWFSKWDVGGETDLSQLYADDG